MLIALLLGYRRVWVWGWLYSELETDRDEWKALALGRLTTDANLAESARRAIFSTEAAKDSERVIREAGRDRRVNE